MTPETKRTRVKFCGLVRLSDLQIAVRLGVDAIGFVFYPPSSRFLTLDDGRVLRRALPSWVSAVGLFVDAAPAVVLEHSSRLGLDAIQFHGNESPDLCGQSLQPDQPYWRAVRMRSADDLITSRALHKGAEAFLLDAYTEGYGGSGEGFDWRWVPAAFDAPLIVSGELHSENVGKAIECLEPVGVDVSSGIQSTPREKDPARMEAFVQAVQAADAQVLKRKS